MVNYEEGTVLVMILDPDTMKPMWEGTVDAVVDFTASPEKRQKRIKRAIGRVMKRFPP